MPKINFGGRQVDATEIDFQTRREDWNEYQLVDGTVIRIKLVLGEVLRIEGEYDREDNPVYQIRSSNVVMVKAPPVLKKK